MFFNALKNDKAVDKIQASRYIMKGERHLKNPT